MRVLVTAASKHGATAEIAQAIGATLADHAVEVTVAPIEDVGTVDGYDAVVVGSAVYAGRWLAPARDFMAIHAPALASRRVWLFSSGPVGDPPKPVEDPVEVVGFMAATNAFEHRLFSGRVNRAVLGVREKAMVIALRIPEGDFRDWPGIRDWAAGIARSLPAS